MKSFSLTSFLAGAACVAGLSFALGKYSLRPRTHGSCKNSVTKQSSVKTVVVASSNRVKVEAVKLAFEKCMPSSVWNFVSVPAPSKVSDQPMSEKETSQGAYNRAVNARKIYLQTHDTEADFYVGLEGGLEEKTYTTEMCSSHAILSGKGESCSSPSLCLTRSGLECFAWMAVLQGHTGTISFGRTGSFLLPPKISDLVRTGVELGHADDIIFGRVNSKEETGTVGILTNNVVTRATYYEQAIAFALIPFLHSYLYV